VYKEQKIMDAKIMQAKGLRQREIAESLGVTERTIRNYLKSSPGKKERKSRASKLDPYRSTVESVIRENPYYNIELLFQALLKSGYKGKISILRDLAGRIRKEVLTEAVIRFETIPGQQAQVDWKERISHTVDGKKVKYYAFVMTLGYSRMPYVQYTRDMKTDTMRACHIDAFKYFGGVPKEILYDNMKTAFSLGSDGNFKPTRAMAELAIHYGFVPKRCRVRRPQTKGKVERTIGYLTGNFWIRLKDKEMSIIELNECVLHWIDEIKHKRISGMDESRAERFKREKGELQSLPSVDLDVRHTVICTVNRESMITWETNRYSVSPELINSSVELRVDRRSREAEIFYAGTSIRKFTLEPPGSRKRIMFKDDEKAIYRQWRKDRDARIKRETKNKESMSVPEVIIRNPSVYDQLTGVTGGLQ
jgi:transposase